jgi:hypothetical protein
LLDSQYSDLEEDEDEEEEIKVVHFASERSNADLSTTGSLSDGSESRQDCDTPEPHDAASACDNDDDADVQNFEVKVKNTFLTVEPALPLEQRLVRSASAPGSLLSLSREEEPLVEACGRWKMQNLSGEGEFLRGVTI